MLMRLPKLLSDENLALVDKMIASGDFVDGSSTTGGPTKAAKDNLQLDLTKHAQREDFMALIGGERLAIVFWIESAIGDQSQREILYDLELAYQQTYKENPKSEALQLIQRAQSNLVRRWSEI